LSGPPSLQLGVSSGRRSQARAFSAPREFEVQLPELDTAAASHWFAVAAPSFGAWYVLRMSLCDGESTETLTLLLTRDQDVIESIEDLAPVAIDSLVCLLPPSVDGLSSIQVVEIGEIWAVASAPTRDPLFVERNGTQCRPRTAQESRDRPGLELFARIGGGAAIRAREPRDR